MSSACHVGAELCKRCLFASFARQPRDKSSKSRTRFDANCESALRWSRYPGCLILNFRSTLMPSPRPASSRGPANRPEKKIGPFAGGIGVAVWINSAQTDDGPRKFRSVTLSPRRYKDPETGDWRDSSSFQIGDLPALIFALQKALEHDYTHPLNREDGHERGEVPY